MATVDLESTAKALVADGKGILAADETPGTLTRRFDALKIDSTPESRRTYREMFFTTPGIVEFISGVIMQDETIRQQSRYGDAVGRGAGATGRHARDQSRYRREALRAREENITEGLDGLRDRLKEYREWAAFRQMAGSYPIGDTLPSSTCVHANAHALARYAALCQEQGLVPIVEPEVLMDGSHTIERCEEVTGNVLRATFHALFEQRVSLEGLLLKPNMVIAGKQCPQQATVEDVALATLRCLRRHVPAAVPGIVFLSGGQDHLIATAHLNAINQLTGQSPGRWLLVRAGAAR